MALVDLATRLADRKATQRTRLVRQLCLFALTLVFPSNVGAVYLIVGAAPFFMVNQGLSDAEVETAAELVGSHGPDLPPCVVVLASEIRAVRYAR